jgi:exportin-7
MCRNYVLSYLWSQPKLPPFVVQGLVTLYSRITKLGWFDSEKEDFVFRNAISDVTKFLGGSAEQCMMGIQLLSQLTCEMNQVPNIGAHIYVPKPSEIYICGPQ